MPMRPTIYKVPKVSGEEHQDYESMTYEELANHGSWEHSVNTLRDRQIRKALRNRKMGRVRDLYEGYKRTVKRPVDFRTWLKTQGTPVEGEED